MEKPVKGSRDLAQSGSLREAVSQARLEEAQNIDSELDLRSSELARLEILKSALEKIFEEVPANDDRFDLALVPSTPARLWIDMFSYVEMDSESQRYRLVRNQREGRRVLVDTSDIGVIKGRITEYLARQIVARERQLAGFSDLPPLGARRRGGLWRLIAAFVIGIVAGAVGLFALGWFLTQ